MHSGKDSGLSGAFGVGTGVGPLGGGSLVERNLNRWTIAFAILFVANTILLLKHPWTASASTGTPLRAAGAPAAWRSGRARDRGHRDAYESVDPVMRKSRARSAGQITPVAKRRP